MNSKAFHSLERVKKCRGQFDEERSQNCRAGSACHAEAQRRRRVTPPDSEATGLGYSFSKLALKGKNRRGMTLVEVLLAAAILGILSIVVINALFYPRLLAVSNTFKQQAILAATDALEQVFSKTYVNVSNLTVNPVGKYTLNHRAITNVTTSVITVSGSPSYKRVTVTVPYPGEGNPVVLETFRYNFNE